MVTAETAAALPALVLVLLASVWLVAASVAQLRCADAAREAARALARGDGAAAGRAVALEVAPPGARVSVASAGGLVRVEVSAAVPLPPPLAGRGTGPRLRGSAVALVEAP